MKLFAALFALAAAQDGQGADATQATEEQSYAAAPTTSYGEESYAPAYVKVHHVCLGQCFDEAPCLNTDTGACVPKGCGYAQPAEYAGQAGYRLLEESNNDYGYEAPAAPETYAAPVEQYQAPVAYAAPAPECGCPDGTVDTGCLYVTKAWPFWVGFILLFLPSAYFICEVYHYINIDDINMYPRGSLLWKLRNNYGMSYLAAGFVLTIASLAYLTMATGHGFILRCCDGRSFYYTRYIDWTLTTPIMLWELLNATANMEQWYSTWIFFLDILMIIAGLIGSLMCGGEKWIFWGFGVICFIPIISLLCASDYTNQFNASVLNGTAEFLNEDLVWEPISSGDANHAYARTTVTKYRSAMSLTVIAWFFYPIVWIFAEGTGSLCSMGEAICYTVLDVISKSVFAYIVTASRSSIDEYVSFRFPKNGDSEDFIVFDKSSSLSFILNF
jgi:bacteriorhodopsin